MPEAFALMRSERRGTRQERPMQGHRCSPRWPVQPESPSRRVQQRAQAQVVELERARRPSVDERRGGPVAGPQKREPGMDRSGPFPSFP
jgi:hypothetical protein